MSDFSNFMAAQREVERRKAECEAALSRLQLARQRMNAMMLISQHEPVNSIGIDREKLRHVLSFIEHGQLDRMLRDISAAKQEQQS